MMGIEKFLKWLETSLANYPHSCEFFSALGTWLAVFVALFLPLWQAYRNMPKVTLGLIGPSSDNGNDYWHVTIENKGGLVDRGALFLVAQRKAGKEEKIHFLRFQWPYEDSEPGRSVERAIFGLQSVDFFSTEAGGRLCLSASATKVLLPKNAGDSMDLAIQLIGEKYQGKKEWLRITKTAKSWNVSRLKK